VFTEVTRRRILIILLRFGGTVLTTAFLAVLLPAEWMASTHERLGLGEFPRTAVLDYLARSVSALYGFHGVLLLLVATDPVRYKPIVSYCALMNVVFGLMLFVIDLHAGMPRWWTALEGPPVFLLGIALARLNR